MNKDEALDLALEELENCADLLKVFEAPLDSCVGAAMLGAEKAITAIKQALAAQPAPVQEPVQECFWRREGYKECPAAQRQWVGLTDEERDDVLDIYITAEGRARAIEAKLKEKNT